jgi:hypothetical protein
MAVTVNASTSSGLVWSSDNTGAMELQTNGTTVASTATNGNFAFNSGYGSAAVAYACRAWVNFNGTGTVAIRASGNVSSITDNGVGIYTVNFTTAMPDANYTAVFGTLSGDTSGTQAQTCVYGSTASGASLRSTTQLQISTGSTSSNVFVDRPELNIAIFR